MENDSKLALAKAVDALIPKNLNDIIREHRENMSLRLATDAELSALSADIQPMRDDGYVTNWHIVARVCNLPDRQVVFFHLLGDKDRGQWITSAIQQVDIETGYVVTANSLYAIGKRGEGEPDAHQLMMLCSALHSWGMGKAFGVPHFFY